MGRVRMDWDWVGSYPIFVYTSFIAPKKFRVKIVKGERGNQNAPGHGPSAPAWIEYIQEGLESKEKVVHQALERARRELKKCRTS